ncbi:MAG: aldo/keto reductase [Elusimicrobiota bacterium]|jgi:aryl-alcohol dehydrogenase-like predicted oxidoreductase|nr:aldo/keto reductase [Elusimicrobiota bacterium]
MRPRVKIKDLEVSKIALGTWALGGGRDWGAADDNNGAAAILKAVELGINFIDTAPIYGNFHSETLLGKTLKNIRSKIVLATKCGLLAGPRAVRRDLSPQSVREELEGSLRRLKTDYIDFYIIHWPDKNIPLSQTLGEMLRLKEAGKIRHIGVSNFDNTLLKEAVKFADIAVVQNEYSYLRRSAGEEVFETARKHNIAFLAYGPLAGGILSGKYKKEPNLPNNDARNFFYKCYRGEAFKSALDIASKFERIAVSRGVSAAQVAINWVLANQYVSCAVCGARNPPQVEDIASALSWRLNASEQNFLTENK